MKMIITGDVALAGGIDKKMHNGGGDILKEDIIGLFTAQDLCLINLECPVTDSEKPKWTHFPTLKASTNAFQIIKKLSVDVASLANNHILDYGDKGLFDTISILEAHGIKWLGAGKTPEEANAPIVFEKNGCCFGILALAQKEISAVGKGSPGAGLLEEKRAVQAISALSEKADITIAYLHFGPEFYDYPAPDQIHLSRALIDAGADLVIGHHPHVVQGYEHYKHGFIAYSLGNFLFDMKPVGTSSSRIGMLVLADIENKVLKGIQMVCVETANGKTELLTGDKKAEAEKHLDHLSSVISNPDLLIEKYYFTCRDHFITYLSAFISFLVIKRNMRNCYDWVVQEFWPQIFRMRLDLVKFVLSGQALSFETKKGKPKEGVFAYLWRGVCFLGKGLSYFGGRMFRIVLR